MTEGVSRTEATGNIVAALYTHDTSRELDPQLLTLPWVGVGADPQYPDATALAQLAMPLLLADVPLAQRITDLAIHGTDDGATAKQLGLQQLLSPYPLYVRRPDAVAGVKA